MLTTSSMKEQKENRLMIKALLFYPFTANKITKKQLSSDSNHSNTIIFQCEITRAVTSRYVDPLIDAPTELLAIYDLHDSKHGSWTEYFRDELSDLTNPYNNKAHTEFYLHRVFEAKYPNLEHLTIKLSDVRYQQFELPAALSSSDYDGLCGIITFSVNGTAFFKQ